MRNTLNSRNVNRTMNLNSFQYTYSRHSLINIDRHVPSASSYHFEDLSKALDPGQGTLAD